MKHIKFPKIVQFDQIIRHVSDHSRFVGLDDTGEPIFDHTKTLPTLTFTGTTKLHGTNSSIIKDLRTGNVQIQSRQNIISPVYDNAGFAGYVTSNMSSFLEMFIDIENRLQINDDTHVCIWGEWVGGNIQKGVALTKLSKRFVVFAVSLYNDVTETHRWSNHFYFTDKYNDIDVYRIDQFPTWSIDIDFNQPKLVQNWLIERTLEVDKECPVGKYFGVSDCGEGIVWSAVYDGTIIRMKIKGESHQSSKIKTIAPVDQEKVKSVYEFIDFSVTDNRLEQGIEQVFTSNGKIPDIKMTGEFIKWVVNDIISEELHTLTSNGLEVGDVKCKIATKAGQWFSKRYKK